MFAVLCAFLFASSTLAIQCPGNSPCGGATDQCCGSRCYSPTTHDCINGVLCGKGNGVCQGTVCYDPNVATCFPALCDGFGFPNASQDVLCGKNLVPCGSICMDPLRYVCSNDSIQQRPTEVVCGSLVCNSTEFCCSGYNFTQCYDPRVSVCEYDPRGYLNTIVTALCPISSLGKAEGVCQVGDVYHKSELVLKCFDRDSQLCCQFSSPGGTASSLNTITEGCLEQNFCPFRF